MPCFSNQNVSWLAPCCACRASNAGPLQLLLSTGLHGWWGEEELYQALQEATSVKVGLWLTNWCTIASWVFTSVAPDASFILLIEQIHYRLYTFLNISLHLFTSLYISLHLFTSLYISLHLFTSLYISLHLFTSLYISLHLFTSLYISLHLFTSLYISYSTLFPQ